MAKKFNMQKELEKLWPKTKKQLDRVAKDAMVLAKKSEKQLIELSEKGKIQFELTMLQVKKEQLFYKIGKAVAKNLKRMKKTVTLAKLDKELKSINSQISSCKKDLGNKK